MRLPSAPSPLTAMLGATSAGDARIALSPGGHARGPGGPSDRARWWSRAAWSVGRWLARPVAPDRVALQRLVPSELADALLRRYLARLPSPGDAVGDGASDLELFVPIGPRDVEIAPLAVGSVRRYLTNRITHAGAATPRVALREVRKLLPDVDVVAEEDVLPAAIRQGIAAAAPAGRQGWLTQQFLSLFHISTAARRPCLVWDADTLMVRPQTLLHGTVADLAISLEHHRPYFRLIRRLLPTLPLPHWSSTVAHHMIMDPDLLRGLVAEIESHAGNRSWWSAILRHVDRREQSCMAEYELYGQWVRHRRPDRVRLVGFRNMTVSRRRLSAAGVEELARARRLDSVSLHWWFDRVTQAARDP